MGTEPVFGGGTEEEKGMARGETYINPTATSSTLSWRAKLEKPDQALEARWEAF